MAFDYPVSATVGNNGVAIAELSMVASAQVWEIRQIACYTGQVANAGYVALWKNKILQAPSAALTPITLPNGQSGSAASASGLPYITLNNGDVLDAIFTGCVAGDIVTANFIMEIYLEQDYIPTPFG